jgi:hypothetical protein
MARQNTRENKFSFIGWFYGRIFDRLARVLTDKISNEEKILMRLKDEEKFLRKLKIEHVARLIGFQHERASTLLTHISIMIALVGVIASFGTKLSDNFRAFSTIETGFYLIIALFLIRCLREFGLDQTYATARKYKEHIMQELAFRFALVRFSNFAAIIVTVFFILGSATELIVELQKDSPSMFGG